jgi:hypothetical protein
MLPVMNGGSQAHNMRHVMRVGGSRSIQHSLLP